MKTGDLVMLYKINEGYVKSDEGYSIKLGKNHLSYMENNNYAVTFSAEDIYEPFRFVIYLKEKDHYWRPPHETEKLTSNDTRKIQSRIIEVLQFLKIKYEIG